MQVCTALQTYNHASTPPLSFLQAGCPSCRPTNSVKALKAHDFVGFNLEYIAKLLWYGVNFDDILWEKCVHVSASDISSDGDIFKVCSWCGYKMYFVCFLVQNNSTVYACVRWYHDWLYVCWVYVIGHARIEVVYWQISQLSCWGNTVSHCAVLIWLSCVMSPTVVCHTWNWVTFCANRSFYCLSTLSSILSSTRVLDKVSK